MSDLRVPAKRGRGTAKVLAQFARELTAKPGEWEPYPFLPVNPSQIASSIRKGSAAFPRGEFEVRVVDGDILIRAVHADH